jgi:hypothetical protein
VLLSAAGMNSGGENTLTRMCSARLLRVETNSDGRDFSIHHEVILERLRGTFSNEQTRGLHRRLAMVMTDAESADAYALYHHWSRAGEAQRARGHGHRAVEQAFRALSFQLAMSVLDEMLADAPADLRTRVAIEEQRARALRGLGCSARAARIFCDLATYDANERTAWLTRAAEQFLIGGEMQTGHEVLREAVSRMDMHLPALPQLIPRTLLELVRARLAWQRRSALTPTTPLDEGRVDLAMSAAKGLAVVNPAFCAYFAFLALRLVARTLPSERRTLAIILAGTVLKSAGGVLGVWGATLLDHVRGQVASDTLRGCLEACEAQTLLNEGQWTSAREKALQAEALLSSRSDGCAWERNLIEIAVIRCDEELGTMRDALGRTERWAKDAEARGDVYANVTAKLYLAFQHVADDRPEAAVQAAHDALRSWPGAVAPFHDFYRLRVQTYAALYGGHWDHASRLLGETRMVAARAGLLQWPLPRTDYLLLSARTTFAAGVAGERRAFRQNERAIRELEREPRPDARAHAALLRAGQRFWQGDRDGCRRALTTAGESFRERAMSLGELYVRYGLDQLEDSSRFRDELSTPLKEQGIARPEVWLSVHVPGFAAATPR